VTCSKPVANGAGNSPEWNEIAIAIGFPSSIYLLRSDPRCCRDVMESDELADAGTNHLGSRLGWVAQTTSQVEPVLRLGQLIPGPTEGRSWSVCTLCDEEVSTVSAWR
jgi:hypothetical protein